MNFKGPILWQLILSYDGQTSENPPAIYGVPVKKERNLGVMHLKGFVFDNTVLYSGASINDVYMGYNDATA